MPTTDEFTREAYERGADAARAAASWTADGNTRPEDAARVLAMLRDGDPEADDFLPRRPDLSGEFADDPTPATLAEEITGLDLGAGTDENVALIDAIADAFERGVSETFEEACEAELIAHIPRPAGHEIAGYVYRAAIYCPRHIAAALARDGFPVSPGEIDNAEAAEVMLDDLASTFGVPRPARGCPSRRARVDRDDERSFDSDEFPKVVLGAELETPEYCDAGHLLGVEPAGNA